MAVQWSYEHTGTAKRLIANGTTDSGASWWATARGDRRGSWGFAQVDASLCIGLESLHRSEGRQLSWSSTGLLIRWSQVRSLHGSSYKTPASAGVFGLPG